MECGDQMHSVNRYEGTAITSTAVETINFNLSTAAPGSLDVKWIHGSVSAKHNTDPDIQVHPYNEHTIILRQNMAVHPEVPFMFLLFGNDRAILLDTGAIQSPEFSPYGKRETTSSVSG